MKNNKKDMNEKNKKKKNKEKKMSMKRCLELTIYIAIIILISLISFFGFYAKNKNTTINKIKEYSLGPDLDKYRNIIIKVDDSTKSVSESEEETPINDESLLTTENYDKVRKIIEDRLKYMKVDYYEIKYNQDDGTINIKVPENDISDYIAQYTSSKGEFKISDNDTKEVLLNNNNIKEAKIGYYPSTTGTSIYLNIEFDKEGKEKLKEISNVYRKTEETNTEENEEVKENAEETENNTETSETEKTKQVTVTLDDSTILTTTFEEEINDGAIQLTLGTSSDNNEIQQYIKQATNIAVFLNTESMPIKYKLDTNELVSSSINKDMITIVILVFSISYVIIWMKSIVRYKEKGILGFIASIGFIAILLLSIRYANVEITLTGICAVYVIAILEYMFLSNMIKVYSKDIGKELKEKEMKTTFKHELEYLLPIAIIAIVFTLTKWKFVTSMGMILFWGILEMIICNLINIKIICKKEEK